MTPDDDWVVYSQDLTTAEMYYAAALSGDRRLAEVFEKGGDFHSNIAVLALGAKCKPEEVKNLFPHLRQASKAISFGILYGAGPDKVAATAGITVGEAKDVIKQYFGMFPQLAQWLKKVQAEIRADGCIYSAFGRKRRVPGVFSISGEEQGHALRSGVNFLVQSVASDVNLMAAAEANTFIRENEYPAEIFALVHDSIIGIVRKDMLEDWEQRLKVFTQKDRGLILPSGHPVGVDFGYGIDYAEAG